ncbi:TIGR00270 family protein [Candidatus Woesearchaeota archaeon]|nr:TIGR00270 family protein [Candidatus Woesearchaeota archaeon]
MIACEMCGSNKNLTEAIVEGVMLTVCENCARFGKVVEVKIIGESYSKTHVQKNNLRPEVLYDIVNDYSNKIKGARETMGLKQEELALKISERASEIHNLESGKLKPSFQLARKLEKFLNIKLIEQIVEDKLSKINFKDKNITIGDVIKLKKSKNE